MLVKPRNSELIFKTELLINDSVDHGFLDSLCLCPISQLKIGNYIINTQFGIRECIEIDGSGLVVDGYIRLFSGYLKYHGKNFLYLLTGDTDITKEYIANPIDKKLYINDTCEFDIPKEINATL